MRSLTFICVTVAVVHAWTASTPSSSDIFLNISGLVQPTIHRSVGGSAICVSGTVNVEASTTANVKFNYELPINQSEVTQAIVSLWSPGANFLDAIQDGTQQVGGNYSIGASLCVPPQKSSAITKAQILTHGIGFDRRYWDFAPGYSYVDAATAAGYATFLYDRLGAGISSHPDSLNVVQYSLEVEILNVLVGKLRQGDFGGRAFTTVVGVAHSFGSALTQGVTAEYPQALDAAVLTGYSVNASGMPAFSLTQNIAIAANNQPYRFSGLSPGYLVVDTAISNQNTFFHAPGFEPSILDLVEATKGTITMGELFTTGSRKVATNFTGPLLVANGNEDLAFCFGNCSYPTNLLAEVVPTLYPSVSANNTATYRAPDAGHGLNLHYAAAEAFDIIQSFLKNHGV